MQMALLPLYIIESGFSNIAAGLASSAYLFSSLLLRPVSGRITDKKGPYSVLVFGAVIYCAAASLYFLSIPVALLIVMRAIQGVGYGFDGTGIYALATAYIPDDRMAEGIGYLGLGQASATALAPLMAISLKNTFGYQTAFVVVFLLSALTLAIFLLLRLTDKSIRTPETNEKQEHLPDPDRPVKKETILSRIVNMNAVKPSLLIMLIMFAGLTINTFLVPYATLGGIANPGIFFTVQAVMVILGRLTMSKIELKVGSSVIIISGMLFIFICLSGLTFQLTLPLLLVCGVSYGMGLGVVHPQLIAKAVLAGGKGNRGMASSTFFMFMDTGSTASGFVFGAIADAAGYTAVYAAAAAVALVTLFLYLVMRKRKLIA